MRSLVALVIGTCVVFAACGGHSHDDDASNAGPSTPSACERYQAAQTVKDACDALGSGCPQTLRAYVATGHGAPRSYARVGCGLTEIRDVDTNGSQTNAYVFDDTGALVGFDRTYRDDSALCATGEYTFGAALADCDDVRECRIAADAADTGVVCGCACPDPPPKDGVLTTTAECVYPVHPIADCQGLFGELTDGVVLRYGCGFYVTSYPNAVTCIYDAMETFVGALREDDASQTCAGVTLLQTEAGYTPCDAEQSCVWGTTDGSDPVTAGLEPCGAQLPDSGGNPECQVWQDLTDIAASCALIAQTQSGECPADEQSYLAGLADPTTIRAIVGCGITWYEPTGAALGGSAFAFDSDGNLVGYDIWGDTTFGPCYDYFGYERGDDLKTCAVVESCDLGDDRAPTCR